MNSKAEMHADDSPHFAKQYVRSQSENRFSKSFNYNKRPESVA